MTLAARTWLPGLFVGVGLLVLGVALPAAAQDHPADTREAGRHFDHGVTLYGEADYPGALAEFKRAYALAPNSAVLYNIGEAQFQLQDYASALGTFTRYLADAPPAGGHRAEVENDLDVLRSRVGHLTILTTPLGADVSIDDQPAGRTPLEDRVIVSVGHRKVSASLGGGALVTRYVDVAADDDVSVTLELPVASSAVVAAAPRPALRVEPHAPARSGFPLTTVGWIATSLLAGGAAGAGAAALEESATLKKERAAFPASPATLQEDSARTRTYSIVADSLSVGSVVVGSVTLFSTLVSRSARRTTEAGLRLRVTPTSVGVEGGF